MSEVRIGSLNDIWKLQAELNRKAGFDTRALGEALIEAQDHGPEERARAELEAGKAIKNYVDALRAECHELTECLNWKHWYAEARKGRQYELRDLQNARVEAIDMLFFWVSICQLLGLDPADVFRLYGAKLGINHRRQDEGRSQAQHSAHEQENRQVV